MVYRSHSHLSDLIQRFIPSLDRRRPSFFYKHAEEGGDGEASLIEEWTNEMYCCKAPNNFGRGGDAVVTLGW